MHRKCKYFIKNLYFTDRKIKYPIVQTFVSFFKLIGSHVPKKQKQKQKQKNIIYISGEKKKKKKESQRVPLRTFLLHKKIF